MMPSTPGPWTSRASSDWQLRAHWNRGRRGMRSTPASGRAVTLKPVRIECSTIIRIGIPTGNPRWRAGTTRGWRSCRRTARVGPLPCASDASSQSWLFQAARTTIADQWRDFYKCHALSLDRLCEKGWDVGEREPVRPQADTNPPVKRLPERLPRALPRGAHVPLSAQLLHRRDRRQDGRSKGKRQSLAVPSSQASYRL